MGYRNQVLLNWCSSKRKFQNAYDVPDFMQIQAVYETTMGTEAFNTVEEETAITAQKSNTRMGKASFTEEKVETII